jgi:CRP/FNR family transcriptional regulator, cyclic AMP receptor protein
MVSRGTIAAGALVTQGTRRSAPSRERRATRARVERLADVPLFADLSRRHLRRIAELADDVSYRDGRTVVESGLPGNAFFVVVDGRVKVYAGAIPSGRPRARLGPGDFFGEMAILDGGPRSATIVADGPVTLLRLPRSAFLKMVSKEPTVAVKIMAGLAGRLRRGAASE